MSQPTSPLIEHASCVVVGERGLLIRGASGSGKSGLALQMMGMGAELVSDDRVQLSLQQDQILASAPDALRGLIEARHLGILRAKVKASVPLCAIVEMDQLETERLPPHRHVKLLGLSLQVFHRVEAPHFAAGLVQYLKAGALDPDAAF